VLPEAVGNLRDVLLWGFPDPSSVPADLLVDLEGKATSSAYRGAQPGGWTGYRGYRLDDAGRRAEMFARRVRNAPHFVLRELRTYALPFVVARFATTGDALQIVLYVDAEGQSRFQRLGRPAGPLRGKALSAGRRIRAPAWRVLRRCGRRRGRRRCRGKGSTRRDGACDSRQFTGKGCNRTTIRR